MDKAPLIEEACYLCPECGSPSVDFGELVGSEASCRICSWKGARERLISAPFTHLQGDRTGIAFELFNDLRRLLGDKAFMVSLVRFLTRWGFVSQNSDQKDLVRRIARYGSACARGMLKAIIEEREALEREAHGG
jgi:hypothetical protein